MPHFYDSFPPHLQEWALEQSIFFTASAPTYGRHINLSPKGVPSSTLAIFDENHAAYLDLTGSGTETISHIYENGRLTVMFCSFTSKPRILRLFCTGRVVEHDNPAFQETIASMNLAEIPGTRAVVLLDIWKVQTSCGYAVPVIEGNDTSETDGTAEPGLLEKGELKQAPRRGFDDRHTLEKWMVNKIDKKALGDYRVKWNSRSLDGLPGLQAARRMKGEIVWIGNARARAYNALYHPMAVVLGMILGVFLTLAALQSSSSDCPSADRVFSTVYLMIHRLYLSAERGRTVVSGSSGR